MINLNKTLDLHKKWIQREPGGVRANFRQLDLFGASLPASLLEDARCSDANFSGADLSGAKLAGASLKYANFTGANLQGADLRNANLIFANFEGANLTQAQFRGADLLNAHFQDATLSWYDFTLLSELVWQAAGEELEIKMLASLLGRLNRYCWQDFQFLPAHHKQWVIRFFLDWIKPSDDAPPFLKAIHQRRKLTSP